MPACYLVNVGEAQIYFDRNNRKCRAPGSRPAGQSNTIYFLKSATAEPLMTAEWDPGLEAFSVAERRCGTLWEKDVLYELNQPDKAAPARCWGAELHMGRP